MREDYEMRGICLRCQKQVGYHMGINSEHGGEYYIRTEDNYTLCECDEENRMFNILINDTVVATIYGGKLVQG